MDLSVEADFNNATQSYPVRSSLYRRNIEYSFWVYTSLELNMLNNFYLLF